MELSAIVVVPARDEQDAIAVCLRALAAQTLPREAFETLVVLDACTDRTAEVVAEQAAATRPRVRTLSAPASARARRAGRGWRRPPRGCSHWAGATG